MKKVLITGLNGFIARHLAVRLKGMGYEITTIDREVLSNPYTLKSALENVELEYIFHLAAYGNHYDQRDETETIATNILKTWFLLDATKDHDYKAFVNVSSSSVYGAKDVPMSENSVLETNTLYGATKIAGEFLARYQAKDKNKPIVNVRPFSVYGPGEAEHRFIPIVIKSVVKGEEFTLDPEVNHDWICVYDFVEGIITVAKNASKLKGQVVNIGYGEQHTNKDVVDKVGNILHMEPKFKVERNMRDVKVKDWVADNTLIKSLGWKPKIDLFSGLRDTIPYYADQQ